MRPGQLYKVPHSVENMTSPYHRSRQGVWELVGFDADGLVSWELIKSVPRGEWIMAVCPYLLTKDNFKPRRYTDEAVLDTAARQASIMATSVSDMGIEELREDFRGDGIPGYKFLCSVGLIWISEIDMEEFKWS